MNGTRQSALAAPSIAIYAPRDRTRAMLRAAFPRRRNHVRQARTAPAFEQVFRETLVDAAIVDFSTLAASPDEAWRVASFAREFPSVPFFAVLPLRASDGPTVAQCAYYEFTDVLVDGVDDAVTRELVLRDSFSARFARALAEPPRTLALCSALQQGAWRAIVLSAGRGIRTDSLARALRVTREHLSRSFAAEGGPNLKRVIDLVRLLAAAELAKNPGYDMRDVANVLGFASASHLSMTSQRIIGTKSASLSRLRTLDLIDRFVRGHGRSRG